MFIAIEGMDGAGKTTAIETIKEYLKTKDKEFLFTSEPDSSEFGKDIKNIIMKEYPQKLSGWTEALLYIAERKEHFDNVISKALKENKIVITDRYTWSTYAYQGGGRGILYSDLLDLHWNVFDESESFEPDLIIYLDIDLETQEKRLNEKENQNRLDTETKDFKEDVLEEYHWLVERIREVEVVDANKSKEEVQKEIKKIIEKYF